MSYSGELDSQRDSAEYMSEVLAKEGYKLKHLIGPGMPHKYHPDVLQEVQGLVEDAVAKGRKPMPDKVVLQFRSARHARMSWVECLEVEIPWADSRIEADIGTDGVMTVTTRNIRTFRVDAAAFLRFPARPYTMVVDGSSIRFIDKDTTRPQLLRLEGQGWQVGHGIRR